MNKLALTNKDQYPDSEILETVLENSFPLYQRTVQALSADDIQITWNYYNDGKAWMGKLLWKKKKNLGWLHIYNGLFKVTIYFTEKYRAGMETLDINPHRKSSFLQTPSVGKLLPMTFQMEQEKDLSDLLCVIGYKKKCR